MKVIIHVCPQWRWLKMISISFQITDPNRSRLWVLYQYVCSTQSWFTISQQKCNSLVNESEGYCTQQVLFMMSAWNTSIWYTSHDSNPIFFPTNAGCWALVHITMYIIHVTCIVGQQPALVVQTGLKSAIPSVYIGLKSNRR